MAHIFKIGEMVECIDDSKGTYHYLRAGKRYVVTGVSPGFLGMRDESGDEHLHLANRFSKLGPMPPGYVKEFSVSATPVAPDIDGRLMAAWLEVPPNCCKACGPGVPLPCAYHPNG